MFYGCSTGPARPTVLHTVSIGGLRDHSLADDPVESTVQVVMGNAGPEGLEVGWLAADTDGFVDAGARGAELDGSPPAGGRGRDVVQDRRLLEPDTTSLSNEGSPFHCKTAKASADTP